MQILMKESDQILKLRGFSGFIFFEDNQGNEKKNLWEIIFVSKQCELVSFFKKTKHF